MRLLITLLLFISLRTSDAFLSEFVRKQDTSRGLNSNTLLNFGGTGKKANFFFLKASTAAVDKEDKSLDSANAYTRFGAPEEDIAIGVDVNELLQWVGTREDIIERVMRDNQSFTRVYAEREVKKLLLDAEVLGRLIFYEMNKDEIIRRQKLEEEERLAQPATLATYATWLIGGASLPLLRKRFIDPKFESGEWKELEITLPKFDFLGGGAGSDAIVSSKITSIFDTTVDTVQVALSTIEIASDSSDAIGNLM